MGPSIDFNSYNNGAMNDNILNQLMQTKANRWGPAIQQGNQGLNQGISNFNNNNLFARMFGFGGGQSGGGGGGVQGGGIMSQMAPMMGGSSGGSGASGAANGLWSYVGKAAIAAQ
jgi:hypothetical protein